jgi:predicted amidophosphoribosyltransferase
MADIDALPIPDWGLACPHCGASLAGLDWYECRQCGEPFNIRQLLARHRPIPDLGLLCPNCDYSLTGLPGSRCPECGVLFSLRAMLEDISMAGGVDLLHIDDPVDHHLKRREPTFTGLERPMPNFGLACARCDEPLAGATGNCCPHCGEVFELTDYTGTNDWVAVGVYVPREILSSCRSILYAADVPYLLDRARLSSMYTGIIASTLSALRVPREFFFDALYAMREAIRPPETCARLPWTCPACEEDVPAGFEICWNCGRAHPGLAGESENEDS